MAVDGKKEVENEGLGWGKGPHPPLKQISRSSCNGLSPHQISITNFRRITCESYII